MNVLVIDVGGTSVKCLVSGQLEPRKFASGPTMTAADMVAGVLQLIGDWNYEAVSIGYPGVIHAGKITAEPENLGPGWLGFDFEAAFNRPVKLINDAAMQALGSYQGGHLLFLGLGTGLGSAMIVDDVIIPMELAHLFFRKGTYEEYIGKAGMERLGTKKWRRIVEIAVARLIKCFNPGDVVLGGGNSKKLRTVPAGCRLGDNSNAFVGGARLWTHDS